MDVVLRTFLDGRMSAGPVLSAASAAIAIAIRAASVVACGRTTSNATRSWAALVTPIVWASNWRNLAPCTALGCSQAARAGVGCGLGSGSGIGGTGVGAPGRLTDGWVWWPGWLVGPLSQ
jgi:hypothetical protein